MARNTNIFVQICDALGACSNSDEISLTVCDVPADQAQRITQEKLVEVLFLFSFLRLLLLLIGIIFDHRAGDVSMNLTMIVL